MVKWRMVNVNGEMGNGEWMIESDTSAQLFDLEILC